MKKTISFILAVVMLFSCMSFAVSAANVDFGYDATGVKVCIDPSDMLNFVLADGHTSAPIRIVPASLEVNDVVTEVYLIGLVGIEMNDGQENVFKNAIPSAFNIENGYTKLIKKVIAENIPAGSNIFFCGHSLGGMVAQQLIADSEVTGNYNIVYTLTAGSPYIMVDEDAREGGLSRLCDKYDAVPWLSGATLFNISKQISGRIVEDGGYFMNPDYAHNVSYRTREVWGEYDVLGIKGGTATIIFDYADLMCFGKAESTEEETTTPEETTTEPTTAEDITDPTVTAGAYVG